MKFATLAITQRGDYFPPVDPLFVCLNLLAACVPAIRDEMTLFLWSYIFVGDFLLLEEMKDDAFGVDCFFMTLKINRFINLFYSFQLQRETCLSFKNSFLSHFFTEILHRFHFLSSSEPIFFTLSRSKSPKFHKTYFLIFLVT